METVLFPVVVEMMLVSVLTLAHLCWPKERQRSLRFCGVNPIDKAFLNMYCNTTCGNAFSTRNMGTVDVLAFFLRCFTLAFSALSLVFEGG